MDFLRDFVQAEAKVLQLLLIFVEKHLAAWNLQQQRLANMELSPTPQPPYRFQLFEPHQSEEL